MRGLLGMGRKAHGRVNNWQQQWVRAAVQQMPRRRFQQTSKLAARSVPHRKELHKAQFIYVAHRACPAFASPLPRLRSLPCALHTSTRVHSTLDTHAARMRASPATCTCTHTATCAHTRQKHHVVPRVTGHWLTVGRPAAEPSSAQSQPQMNSPDPTAREPRASSTRCARHSSSLLCAVRLSLIHI